MCIKWNLLNDGPIISVFAMLIYTQKLLTFSAAPALATAKLTPRIALAPRLVLFGVPSSLFKNASTAA